MHSMKKPYEKLEIDVVVFEKKDVITASGVLFKAHDNAYIDYSQLFNSFFSS